MKKEDLPDILRKTLHDLGGKGTIVEICRHVWENYQDELQKSGDLLYTWQYDIRWAATALRKLKIMRDKNISPKGVWELNT